MKVVCKSGTIRIVDFWISNMEGYPAALTTVSHWNVSVANYRSMVCLLIHAHTCSYTVNYTFKVPKNYSRDCLDSCEDDGI